MQGWHEILDNGRWTESEKCFRKAVEFDPGWPLGKSLVGRITRNLDERERILEELRLLRDKVEENEGLLLEVNLLSLEAANNRDKGIANTNDFNGHRKRLAEANFGEFVHKYPQDAYIKAEYIEFLHANHGARMALDSLNALATKEQKKLGFYITYAASLELELGNLEGARAYLQDLQQLMLDSTYTSCLKLSAEILIAQDSLDQAMTLLDSIVKIDSNHLIASGMLTRIKQQMTR